MSGLYSGGVRVGSSPYYSLRHYNLAGTQQQTGDLGATVRGFACAGDGSVVVCGETSTLKKYSNTLTQDWSRSTGNSANYAVALDAEAYYYVAGNGGIRKYNSAGTEQWSQNPGGILSAVAVDASGNVYVGGLSQTLTAYDADGDFLWSASHGNSINGLTCDADNNVYLVGNRSSTGLYSLRKYTSAGDLSWSKSDHGSTLYAVTVGDDGTIYVGGTRSSSITTRHYSSDGALDWSRDYSYNAQPVYSVTVDADQNVYVVSEYRTLAYDGDGSALWNQNHGGTLYAVAVWRDPVTTTIPAMSIPLGLSAPSWGIGVTPPGLPLVLGLALPSAPALTPPFVVGTSTHIYRGYVSGGDPLEIPLISLQCRRRRGDSTWLSVHTSYSIARWVDLKARLAVGAELLIYAGYRTPAGEETTGIFLRATVTAIDLERTGWDAFIALTARVIPTPYSAAHRPLYGVTRRGLENERQTARCAVIDPLLRPGDTVDDGLATWEVGAILYFISVTDAWMDVTEEV